MRIKIERLAYQMWELAGRPAGDGVAFWLAAENEVLTDEVLRSAGTITSVAPRSEPTVVVTPKRGRKKKVIVE